MKTKQTKIKIAGKDYHTVLEAGLRDEARERSKDLGIISFSAYVRYLISKDISDSK